MTRYTFGPVTVVAETPDATDDPTTAGFTTTAVPVSRTLGGANETDLLAVSGYGTVNGDGTITPDATSHLAACKGPDGFTGPLFFANQSVHCNELPSLIASWSALTGKPAAFDGLDDTSTTADIRAAIEADSNVYMAPVWDGTGTEPARATLADGHVEIFRQPTAPTHGAAGDEWEGV